jgi:hypothetical protein
MRLLNKPPTPPERKRCSRLRTGRISESWHDELAVAAAAGIPSSIEYIRAGKLRELAVTTAARSDALRDIPTMADFVPGYEASAWFGVGAPGGLDDAAGVGEDREALAQGGGANAAAGAQLCYRAESTGTDGHGHDGR